MKKTKITSGNWETMKFLNDDGTINSITVDRGEESDKMICSLQDSPHYEDEFEANAKSIAAVPEMIDALIQLIELAGNAVSAHGYDPSKEKAITNAEKALEKAGVEF